MRERKIEPNKVPSLDHLILHLSKEIRRNLQNADAETVDFLQATTRTITVLKESEHYFQAIFGKMDETDEISKGQPKKDFQWYWSQCFPMYTINLLLPKQKLLPATKIAADLHDETTASRLLMLDYFGEYPVLELTDFFRKAYHPLNRGGLQLLYDRSEIVKEYTAEAVIKTMLQRMPKIIFIPSEKTVEAAYPIKGWGKNKPSGDN